MNNVNEKEIIFEELKFIKQEQKYVENKFNIIFITLGIVNGLLSTSISFIINISTINHVLYIIILLIPIIFGLIGIWPRKINFFIKKSK